MTDGREHYYLGLPGWAFPGWKDRYFTDAPSRLASYAAVFNTVEGNTTFYRVPDAETVARWREAVADRPFCFCFKLPREVTHERRPDMALLGRFLDVISPLGDRLGPLLVQFPATFAPEHLETFEPVFAGIAAAGSFAIEPRHPDFFSEPGRLEGVLERYAAGRVMLDSRPIFEGDRAHPELLDALHEKPDVPVLQTVYNDIALIRLILHPDLASNEPWIESWAGRVADYLLAGIRTHMMIHCPNNLHCPPLAQRFHEALRRRLSSVAPLPAWPVPQQRELL